MIFQVSDADVDRWLDEDVPYGDLTTHLLGIGGVPARMTFRTRAETVIGGVREAARLLERVGCAVEHRAAAGALAGRRRDHPRGPRRGRRATRRLEGGPQRG